MEAENIESMDLESLKNLVEESIEDLVLEKMGSSLDRPIMSIAREVLLGGGKRYRPILVIMAYKAAGGVGLQRGPRSGSILGADSYRHFGP